MLFKGANCQLPDDWKSQQRHVERQVAVQRQKEAAQAQQEVPGCAVLCCAVLCCAVLCCAVLCCAALHGAVLVVKALMCAHSGHESHPLCVAAD